ncbi:MAG: hypothetical protein PVI06_10085 [Desulfobacterales bacterium]
MADLQHKFILVFMSLALVNALSACAASRLMEDNQPAVEIWQIEFTGQTVGSLKMTLKRYAVEKGIQPFKGKLSGPIKDHRGGFGDVGFKLKGKINKDVFTASIGGYAHMAEGPSSVSGKMQGKIVGSQGSGTWRVTHALGLSSGKYTMKKIN